MDHSERQKLIQQLFDESLSAAEVENLGGKALSQDYWRGLIPILGIEDTKRSTATGGAALDETVVSRHTDQFRREGYFQTAPVLAPALTARMRAAIETLRNAGWPPVFSFVYDEFWDIVRTPAFAKLATGILGAGYRQNSLIWTFYVPTARGARGWEPHADGGLGESRVTIWVPFTDATLDNGCMYVIPRDRLQDDLRGQYADLNNVTNQQLTRLLHNTRAVPSPAGAYVGWSHELIHWGSVSSGLGDPRISIAVEFVGHDLVPRPDEQPLFDTDTAPPFMDRIRAIGKALLAYRRYEPSFNRYAALGQMLFEARG